MFYTIPDLKKPDAESFISTKAAEIMEPVSIGTGHVRGGVLTDGTAEVNYIDCKHGVFKSFKAENFAAAYFEAIIYAEESRV